MKRYEYIGLSAENAGLYLAEHMRCPDCPAMELCLTAGKKCNEVLTDYYNQEVEEDEAD
jgi:hypothetical protein